MISNCIVDFEPHETHHGSNNKVVIWAGILDEDEPADASEEDEQH